MAGNPKNAAVWGGADVLISRNLNAVIPSGNDLFDINQPGAVITAAIVSTDATVTGTGFDDSIEGATVTGAGIPANTTVLSVTDATHFELSNPASATNASASLTIGATTDGWDFVGILDGGQGFEEENAAESTDHTGWGYGVIATTYKGQKTTRTFTAVEENSTVMSLLYETTDVVFDDEDGTYEGELGVRDHSEHLLIAFVLNTGGREKRAVSTNYATVAPSGAAKDSEESLSTKGFTATIVPTASKKLWTVYKGPAA